MYMLATGPAPLWLWLWEGISCLTDVMVWGCDVDLEAPLHISELNSAIMFLSLKNMIALFSSELKCVQ